MSGGNREKGRFERFWNRLFTYAYDCDRLPTLLVNESFFIAAAIVLAWLCSLVRYLNVKALGWAALALLIVGEIYFIVSFYIGIQTYLLAVIRKRRGTPSAKPENGKPDGKPQKPGKKKYRISNRRL